MTTQAGSQRVFRNVQRPLRLLSILIVLLSLLSLAHIGSGQDEKRGPPDTTHMRIMMGKQNAWLNRHPVLFKVSQISFAGVPGKFLTDTCWLFVRTISRHPHPQAPSSKQIT